MNTILLLEDDANLNRGISLKLTKEGYDVRSAFTIKEAKELFNTCSPDLIISDITLPDGSGLDFCADIRRKSNVFRLFLTAMDSEVDMVNGYDMGADDYITKPFSLMVLVSKVHAFMRRADSAPRTRIRSGEITVSYTEMKAYRLQEPLSLSKKELQLLVLFMENARQVLTKDQILEHVWDTDGQFVDDNTVPVNISRLKGKLGGSYIQNVRGIGYIWTEESYRE
ncbi:MAG TPA: response regulator transcription factor [Candidatus Mediterraneibacter norfolkensis]|nr:response regulator transcription factor [Candidatus Mediterraneibacter norfolkensis]